MLFTTILHDSMIKIAIITTVLNHLTYSYDTDESNECLIEYGSIYCNLPEQAYDVRLPFHF